MYTSPCTWSFPAGASPSFENIFRFSCAFRRARCFWAHLVSHRMFSVKGVLACALCPRDWTTLRLGAHDLGSHGLFPLSYLLACACWSVSWTPLHLSGCSLFSDNLLLARALRSGRLTSTTSCLLLISSRTAVSPYLSALVFRVLCHVGVHVALLPNQMIHLHTLAPIPVLQKRNEKISGTSQDKNTRKLKFTNNLHRTLLTGVPGNGSRSCRPVYTYDASTSITCACLVPVHTWLMLILVLMLVLASYV